MACIKYLSVCPCPTCLVQKLKIYLLGSKSDAQTRENLQRKDTETRKRKIEQARKLIFKGVNVTSKKIDAVLGADALVHTRVCSFTFCVR